MGVVSLGADYALRAVIACLTVNGVWRPLPQQANPVALETPRNLVLIGMPGSGKSTVGVVLAKRTGRGFVDTDLIIQEQQHQTLQQIVDHKGQQALLDAEERACLSVAVEHHVVATGGSVVYSEPAMAHLEELGVLVYLATDLATLETRVGDYTLRGLAKRSEQTLADLFHERADLYRRYAKITVETVGKTHDEVGGAIEAALAR